MADDVQELLIARLDRLENKVDALTADMHELRGGTKAMLWVAGTLGAILALASRWLMELWRRG